MLQPIPKFVFVLVTFFIATLLSAHASQRYALVIGNSAYTGSSPLKNPKNDAELIAKTLAEVGFKVTTVTDANQRQMRRAMLEFSRTLRNNAGSIGLFYYAGHGVQVRGINYMVPVTADITDEDEVRFEGVDVNDFLNTMRSSNARLNIIILDACRNNPFARSFRSASRGLAPVQAASGTLIAYSTAPGDVAFDGNGLNSPYTLALSRFIRKQGLRIETVFKRVLASVEDATERKQTPWLTGAFRGEFFFVTKKPKEQSSSASQTNANRSSSTRNGQGNSGSLEKLFWESIVNSKNPASFKAYKSAFPKGVFVPLANLKISELKKASTKTTVASLSKTERRGVKNKQEEQISSTARPGAPPKTPATPPPSNTSSPTDNTLVYKAVFPKSSVKRLTRSVVEPLSCHKLWIARNEIDYRNGLCFKSEKGIRYFDNSNCTTSRVKLSSLEHRNKRTIRTWEIRKRCKLKHIANKVKKRTRRTNSRKSVRQQKQETRKRDKVREFFFEGQ